MGDPVPISVEFDDDDDPISVPALFVKGLHQDLIGGKAINKLNIRVILDDVSFDQR